MTADQADIVVQIRAATRQLRQLRDINANEATVVAFSDDTYQGLCALLDDAGDEIVAWRKQTASSMNTADELTATVETLKRHNELAAFAAQQLAIELTTSQQQLAATSEIAATFWRHLATPAGPAADLDAALDTWQQMSERC